MSTSGSRSCSNICGSPADSDSSKPSVCGPPDDTYAERLAESDPVFAVWGTRL